MALVGRNCLTCVVRGKDCFCRLPAEALLDLQSLGNPMRFEAGESLLHEGYSADRVYIACQGRIKLTASSPEGRVLIVRVAGPGDVLGLAAVLKGTVHKVAAEALEPCEVKAMGRAQFLEFMEKFSEVSRNVTISVASEYEGAMLSARRLALSGSAAGKLASVLLEWGRMGHEEETMEFHMPLTHEELGSMAGLSRETVTRLLGRFSREGLLEQVGDRMMLREPKKLELLYR